VVSSFWFKGTTWCGYCKAMTEDLEVVASALRFAYTGSIGDVDCTSGSKAQLCAQLGITSYPTLKLYKNSKFSQDYAGPRTAESMARFVMEQAYYP
jgi:thiol-disulfide isomerase/thioredoxin